MSSNPSLSLHPVVASILDDFEAMAGGPRLRAVAVSGWADLVVEHPERDTIAVHLIAMAARFARAGMGGVNAMAQCVALAMSILGAQRAEAALRDAGIDAGKAKKLVEGPTRGLSSPLADGLAPPGSKSK